MTRHFELLFGNDVAQLELDDACDVTHCEVQDEPLSDTEAAAYAAVSNPTGYPPIACACVPGDRVVVAVDLDVPEAEAVIRGVLRALGEGASEIDVSILCASASMAGQLNEIFGDEVKVASHDPQDKDQMAYLAALKDGRPILIHRSLQESDVVIPIGTLRPMQSFGYAGVGSALFPAFSDAESQSFFRAASADHATSETLREQAAEAAWLLGIQFTVQVVPGANGRVLGVLAGDCHEVEAIGRKRCDDAWTFAPAFKASLVIATIDGGEDQQTWDNFARALDAARRAANDDADILICSGLVCEPGPALLELGGDLVDEELSRELKRRRSADVGVATLLFDTLQNSHVHLVSELPEGVVYGLGLTPVDPQEIDHVAGRHQQCTIIPSAHRVAIDAQPIEVADSPWRTSEM